MERKRNRSEKILAVLAANSPVTTAYLVRVVAGDEPNARERVWNSLRALRLKGLIKYRPCRVRSEEEPGNKYIRTRMVRTLEWSLA